MATPSPAPERRPYFCTLAWGMIPLGLVLAIIVPLYTPEHDPFTSGLEKCIVFIFTSALVLASCTIPCAIFCGISMVRKERFALFSLIPGIPCGIIALVFVSSMTWSYIASRQAELNEQYSTGPRTLARKPADNQAILEEKLLADARVDVTCILKDRWDLQNDRAHRHAMEVVLRKQRARISDSLAHEIYQTMPTARDCILDHPAFDADFLDNCFQEIKNRVFTAENGENKDVRLLNAIVNNPNCPRKIFEAVLIADSKNRAALAPISHIALQRLANCLKKNSTPASFTP